MKLVLTVLAFAVAPLVAFAACDHQEAAMSCAEGSSYDHETRSCVPATG